MHLVLSRVAPQDFDQMVPMAFRAFQGQQIMVVFFGHESPASYAHVKRTWAEALQEQADVFLKITDVDAEIDVDILDECGHSVRKERQKRIVCGADWKIYPTYVAPKEAPKVDFLWLDDEQERKDAATIMYDLLDRRKREQKEPHILCYELFVDPEYQRKGIGRMMMQWANDTADTLMLSCWLEASVFGEGLYLQMGYEVTERITLKTKSFETEYPHMRRPAMVGRMEGTKLTRKMG